MEYGKIYLTEEGKKLAVKTLHLKTLKFLHFKVGDGEIENIESIQGLTDLVNPVLEFNITKISTENDTQAEIKGVFSNINILNYFYLRELGLYAEDPDTSEIVLFAYVNFGNKAEFIAKSDIERKEIYYDLIVSVGNSNCVEIKINTDTIYATEKDLENLKKCTTTKKYKIKDFNLDENLETALGTIIELPFYYKTNTNALDVYLNGEYLHRCDVLKTNLGFFINLIEGSYYEVDENGEKIFDKVVISNKIQITDDWKIDGFDNLEIIVKGEVEKIN